MATKKPEQSLADYVTIALSPLLIMALVGSLVFFLLEILYVGQYSERLQWTLFFFVFGMVLIARISIEMGYEKASLYGIALGIVVYLALLAYVEYPPGTPSAAFGWLINPILMAVIWWCAHRLTWDCTYIDDKVDASGKGVLEAAGLDEAPADPDQITATEEEPQNKKAPSLLAWWDRYKRYRDRERKKPHTPGVWVVYFSLAALPIYGLGQSLIPTDEVERRQRVFWLMACYVASGLGLLLTTSFLGLRRYLRQRKLTMPVGITATWLTLGGMLIVVLMLVGALLPRPYGEYQLIRFTPLGSRDRDASQFAVNRDGAGKGEGQASRDESKQDPNAKGGSGTQDDDNEGKGQKSSKSGQGSSGQKGSGSGQQKGGKGGSKSGEKSGDKSNDTSQSKEGSRPGENQDQQDQERKDDQARDKEGKENEEERKDQKQGQQNQQSGGQGSKQQQSSSKPGTPMSSSGGVRPPSSPRVTEFFSKFSGLATFLKWLVFIVLALVVLFFIFRSGLRFLANFTNWAKQLLAALQAWWAGLFGNGKEKVAADAEAEMQARAKNPRPFETFQNPFQDGSAEQLSPEEVVRYSFEALQSWAWEHDLGRQPQETPLEFAERLIIEVPAMETEARGLAGLYARAAYARGRLNPGCLATVKQFWNRLETVEEKPLSA